MIAVESVTRTYGDFTAGPSPTATQDTPEQTEPTQPTQSTEPTPTEPTKKPDRGIVFFRNDLTNQRDELVCESLYTMMIRRRPSD